MARENRKLLIIEMVDKDTGEMKISAETTEEIEIVLTTIYGLLKTYIDDGIVTMEDITEGIENMADDPFELIDDYIGDASGNKTGSSAAN